MSFPHVSVKQIRACFLVLGEQGFLQVEAESAALMDRRERTAFAVLRVAVGRLRQKEATTT